MQHADRLLPKKTAFKAQTLTNGTLFLSSWTDKLVFVTKNKKYNDLVFFRILKQNVTNLCCSHNGATLVYQNTIAFDSLRAHEH